ncbi:Fic family protein [Lapidilactobacillus luobeiensis]|uniref:Fic family protein n=1 Tax=Lapidilactobacillus luobeiensis TaxID=2950371 RepID=UPI0021C4216E|nr:Fic family protein [Lapidilactobacillus luobeiensis]
MDYPNKFKLTPDQNRSFTKRNFTKLVQNTARFEGVQTTLSQTQMIMDGLGVAGVSIDDSNVIVQVKLGWEFIITHSDPLGFRLEQQLNLIVAKFDSLAPGEVRSGNGSVALGEADDFIPPEINQRQEEAYVAQLLGSQLTTTDRALTLLYHNMRQQIFWDGNKRTAILAANKIMIDGGAGLINVPLDRWPEWNNQIAEYYRTNEMDQIKTWTYENGIQGIKIAKKRRPSQDNGLGLS